MCIRDRLWAFGFPPTCAPSTWDFWSNWLLVANFAGASCKLWNVCLIFQVGAFAPPCVYFYLRDRAAGYACALLLALACLLCRLALLLAAAPRADAEAVAERSAALAEAPYCRGAEALLGVLVAFSFCDERFKFDGTVTGIAALDFFHGGEAAAAVEPPPAGDGGADGAGHGLSLIHISEPTRPY